MTYTKNTWVDQNVTRPRTYTVTTNQDSTITLTDSFGVVTELGTPVNATNMNHIEQGIYDCYAEIDTKINAKVQIFAWQNATSENISLTSVTAIGSYNVDLSTILPNDSNSYECVLRYFIVRRDNNSDDSSYKITSSGGKVWIWEHVEGDAQLATNYRRKTGQFSAIVGSERKLVVAISEKALHSSSLELIMYRKCVV